MNAADMKQSLVGQGIAASLAEVMVKQAVRLQAQEAKKKEPKAAKKKGNWYPGMEDSSAAVDTDVEVTVVCQTCGDVQVKTIQMKCKKGSPKKQKLAITICNHCPEFFRSLDFETLVTLVMLNQHPALQIEHTSVRQQVRIARHMTPEQVVTYKVAK